MIKENAENERRRKNVRWIVDNKSELYRKYRGCYILIVNCKVMSVGKDLGDLPHEYYKMESGKICYKVPTNWDYFKNIKCD